MHSHDALARVRTRNARLARQADPLGLTCGTYEPEGDEGPTRARLRNAPFGIDLPEVGQRVDRRAHAVRDIFADLRRRQQIDADQYEAGKTFQRHYELAYRGRSVTPSYGTRWAEGTPLSQIDGAAAEDDTARTVDYVRLHRTALAILPPLVGTAMLCACDGHTPGEIGARVSAYTGDKAAAAGVTRLQMALEMLVVHYGIKNVAK
jgi:hypothetical protein